MHAYFNGVVETWFLTLKGKEYHTSGIVFVMMRPFSDVNMSRFLCLVVWFFCPAF